ncbi:MAG: hypothetical protein WC943_17000, partial [Elusimicrobiota bacterium]
LNIRYYQGREASLSERIAGLEKAGEPVFVTSRTLAIGDWRAFFGSFGLTETARGPHGTVLFRVIPRSGKYP